MSGHDELYTRARDSIALAMLEEPASTSFPFTRGRGGHSSVAVVRAAVTDALLEQVRLLGLTVKHSWPLYDELIVEGSLERLEQLERSGVAVRSLPVASTTSRRSSSLRSHGDEIGQAAVVAHQLQAAADGLGGKGVRIGVISDGIDGLGTSQSAGHLPSSVTVLSGQAGSGSEGTAMLELIHALAPNTTLFFATGKPSQAAFATNIAALKDLGVQIIVDDLQYLDDSVFQDGSATPTWSNGGIIAQAFKNVANSGVLCIHAAGNGGSFDRGASNEATFVASSTTLPFGTLHDFAPGEFLSRFQKNTSSFYLQWSDPMGALTADFDFYILDASGSNVLFSGNAAHAAVHDPVEFLFVRMA